MQNTNCSQFCERYRKVKILGKTLEVKGYICSPDGINYRQKPRDTKLQMSVCPTTFCPAACRFCIANDTKRHDRIDLLKFEETMRALKKEDVIRGVKITGGEPFYDIELLNQVISILFKIFGFEFEVSVSTNGIGLKNLDKLEYLRYIETIHLSRHHYDDKINRELFGYDVPNTQELKKYIANIPYKDIFVINCMLLKDYINSPDEVHKMLDYAISIGVPKVGFMGCTQINAFAKEQYIPFEKVINDNDSSVLFTRGFTDYEFCRCRDGIYASPNGEIIELYGRNTGAAEPDYCRGLVYGADNYLRTGFKKTIIA